MNGVPGKTSVEISVLNLDVSGSMKQKDFQPSRLVAAEEAAIEFIGRKRILDRRDVNTVVAFNTSAWQVSAFGRHPFEVTNDIKKLSADGGTNVTSGLKTSLDLLQRQVPKAGVATLRVILLTDGEHNTGQAPREDGIVDRVRRAGVIVDTVLIGSDGERLLRDIADATGGIFVKVTDFKKLLDLYRDLALKKSAPMRPQ